MSTVHNLTSTRLILYLFSLRGQDVNLDQHLHFRDRGGLAGVAQVKLSADLEIKIENVLKLKKFMQKINKFLNF